MTPDRPETGYGYILSERAADAGEREVRAFVEKPDLTTAERYLREGVCAWNAGMSVLRASTWLSTLARFRPDIETATRTAFAERKVDGSFVRPGKASFVAVPAVSIDYAVMERCPGSGIDIRMAELVAGWNDLGAWAAVWQVGAKDEAGNLAVGDTIVRDSRNTLVHSTSRLVSAVALTDMVVVETPDAVLVVPPRPSEEVKQIVGALAGSQRGEQHLHRKVHRPWGWYDSVDEGPGFQVKRIAVNNDILRETLKRIDF